MKLDQKTIDVLVANIIPTSKYFEARFDYLQYHVDELNAEQKTLLEVMEKRFAAFKKMGREKPAVAGTVGSASTPAQRRIQYVARRDHGHGQKA